MEMLQPTREMYMRGTSSSLGTGAWDSCCRKEGEMGDRSMEMPSQQ